MAKLLTPDTLASAVGEEIGVSEWYEVTQENVNKFADVTSDHQFIHVDPLQRPHSAAPSHMVSIPYRCCRTLLKQVVASRLKVQKWASIMVAINCDSFSLFELAREFAVARCSLMRLKKNQDNICLPHR